MSRQWGNPEVKEWMRKHPDEVGKIQKRYDELKERPIEELLTIADDFGVDLTKVRDKLIVGIIAAGQK